MMTDRERKLVEALTAILNHVENEHVRRVNNQCTLCYTFRKLGWDALAAYSPPPNAVFSQDVPFDSRAEFSLGHREKFGVLEND